MHLGITNLKIVPTTRKRTKKPNQYYLKNHEQILWKAYTFKE